MSHALDLAGTLAVALLAGLLALVTLAVTLFVVMVVLMLPFTVFMPPGWMRTMLVDMWAKGTKRSGFAAPMPGVGEAPYRIAHLLLHHGPVSMRNHIEDAFSMGVPYSTMWRWGRVYGPEVLVDALFVHVSASEWLAPFLRDQAKRTEPDLEGLRMLAALTMPATNP